MKEIELPDGTIAEFPDDMSDAQISAVLQRQFGKVEQPAPVQQQPVQQPSRMDRFLQAAKPEMGVFRGMRDPIDAGAQMLVRGANAVGLAPDSEVSRVDQMNRQAEQSYQQGRGDTGFDALRLGGNILATAPLTSLAPVGAGLGARTAIGAATGAGFGSLQPVENAGEDFWQQKGQQAKTGAIAGGLAAPITGALARIISPKTSPDVKKLMGEGVTPTPGQVLGGAFKSTEDKLTSIPILGDAIRAGQRRGIGDLNKAAINRALFPIGKSLPKGVTGREAIKFADDTLGQYYDDVLARVGPVKLDQQLSGDVTRILGGLSGTPDKAQQFVTELQAQIGQRAKNGVLNGQAFKDIESTLGQRAASYGSSPLPADRDLGKAFAEAQKAMRGWLERAAPRGVADDVKKANQGWASFVRVQNAAASSGSDQGVFTAAQLSQGVKKADRSVRKGSFAKGEALMQDLSDAAKSTLSQSVPDSGTPGRIMAAALAGGGLGYLSPTALTLTGAAALPYTPFGQRAAAALLASRPQLAEPVSQAVRQAGIPVLTGGLYGLLGQ